MNAGEKSERDKDLKGKTEGIKGARQENTLNTSYIPELQLAFSVTEVVTSVT
jgi:hypothetical protein